MELEKKNGELFCRMKNLWVKVTESGFSVFSGGESYFEMMPGTSVSGVIKDIDEKALEYSFSETEGGFFAEWKTSSNLWKEKIYKIEVKEEYLLYTVTVKGEGKIEYTEFFNGAEDDGQIFYDASGYFMPQVSIEGHVNDYHNMDCDGCVGIDTFSPTVTCFAFDMEGNDKMLGVGIAPNPGEYNFEQFEYKSTGVGCIFACDFKGYTEVSGELTLPGILFLPGYDEYDILKSYSEWMYTNGGCKRVKPEAPRWWHGPFFCGWGDQWIASKDRQSFDWADEAAGGEVVSYGAKDAANEKEYNIMTENVAEKGIEFSMIIIDDKWQKEYGTLEVDEEKWPDLRRYIDDWHSKGKKVTLWYNLWGSEGLDKDECILKDGDAVALDPTSPKYIKRIEKAIKKLLSDEEGCYNADGFKLDFANLIPRGKGLEIYEKGVYGIELLKRNIENIFRIAKKVKPDCLITHTDVHPYFGEITDMIRLHDYYAKSNKGWSNMYNRSFIAKAAFGEDVMIDTDAPGGFRRRDAMQCVRHQPDFGVPVLYGIKLYSFLTDEDWEEVKNIYNDYSKEMNKKYN